tara:strand:+ start:6687 stop:7163 length:477 start_codon:yes stop_codon:yes gene_type:complete
MPVWRIKCECGSDTSTRLTFKKREEEYGGLVPCVSCDDLNNPLPAIRAVTGCKEISIKQVGQNFANAAELDRYCEENDCEAVAPNSKRWQDLKDQARQGHMEQVKAEGYRDIDDKRNKRKQQKVDRVRANQQKTIDKYHDNHGSSGKKTVEQAYGSVK